MCVFVHSLGLFVCTGHTESIPLRVTIIFNGIEWDHQKETKFELRFCVACLLSDDDGDDETKLHLGHCKEHENLAFGKSRVANPNSSIQLDLVQRIVS